MKQNKKIDKYLYKLGTWVYLLKLNPIETHLKC